MICVSLHHVINEEAEPLGRQPFSLITLDGPAGRLASSADTVDIHVLLGGPS